MDKRNLPYKRHQRVSEIIKEEFATLLFREIEFDGALVTVINVEVTKKLDIARVYISVLPNEKTDEVIKKLERERKNLQFKLHNIIQIKPMPELLFILDKGLEAAAKIEKIFLDNKIDN